MKNCLKIPRLLLPEEGFEHWAVVAGDAFSNDRFYWESVEKAVGDKPSAYRFIIPDALMDEEGEDTAESIRRASYISLEKGELSKLRRGGMYVRRKTPWGIRQGVLLCVDLEEFTRRRGESSPVRASQETDETLIASAVALRRRAILEFPHTVIFYSDKKSKVNGYLKDADLEKLYDFELMREGGKITGYFIPEEEARYVGKLMHARGEPCFTVAEGEREIAAAKEYWEELKTSLSRREQAIHPARYLLAEFVNVCDDAVKLLPVHRVLSDVEPEAFCEFFTKEVKCKRKGNVLYPVWKDEKDVALCSELIKEFIKRNGGTVRADCDERFVERQAGDCSVGIVFPETDKKDYLAWMKDGILLPEKTFTLGKERYHLEGREISYD